MTFKIVAPTRCKKSGAYIARKGIPADIRDAHEKLYGSRYETKFYARGNVPLHEVKRRFSEWQAELSTRIEALRRAARGEGRTLSHREVHALAGEWYGWFVGLHEAEPGAMQKWSDLALEVLHSRLGVESPAGAPPPSSKEELRGFVCDLALTGRFLLEKGVVLTPDARDKLLDAITPDLEMVALRLARHAEGDYRPDVWAERFPNANVVAGMTCWELSWRGIATMIGRYDYTPASGAGLQSPPTASRLRSRPKATRI
jgi:hypothetical protein